MHRSPIPTVHPTHPRVATHLLLAVLALSGCGSGPCPGAISAAREAIQKGGSGAESALTVADQRCAAGSADDKAQLAGLHGDLALAEWGTVRADAAKLGADPSTWDRATAPTLDTLRSIESRWAAVPADRATSDDTALMATVKPRLPVLALAADQSVLFPGTVGTLTLASVDRLGGAGMSATYIDTEDEGRGAKVAATWMAPGEVEAAVAGAGKRLPIGDAVGAAKYQRDILPGGPPRFDAETVTWGHGDQLLAVQVYDGPPPSAAVLQSAAVDLATAIEARASALATVNSIASFEGEAGKAKQERDKAMATAKGIEAGRAQKAKLSTFMDAITSSGIDARFIVRVESDDNDDHTIVVVVGAYWFLMPKQLRLQAAQNMWQLWAKLDSPRDLDKARIKLLDQNGNKVGGSGLLAGSMVDVDE